MEEKGSMLLKVVSIIMMVRSWQSYLHDRHRSRHRVSQHT